jgi:putative ABC transport system permease protein
MYDLRYALRSLLRAPGFAAAAILTLAIAIGANAAMFSILYGVVLHPLDFRDPSRVVRVWETDPHNASYREGAAFPDFEDWKAQQRVFSSMAGMTTKSLNLTEPNALAEQLSGLAVSSEYFSLLGVPPVAGRDFIRDDDKVGAAPVAILSDGLWRRRFGAQQNVIGRSVMLDGTSYEVVGVMPANATVSRGTPYELWVPLATSNPQFRDLRGVHNVYVIGRLKDGVSLRQAQTQMSVIMTRLAKQYPKEDVATRGANVENALDAIVRDARPRLWILSAAVLAVLLIACINVAGLLLARADARARELAVRASMGASRARLARQLITESATIAVIGGALGIALAWWLTRTFVALAPALPRAQNIALNLPVLLFTAGVSLVSAMLFGIVPALRSSAVKPAGALAGARGVLRATRTAGRGVMVIIEVALAVVLVIGAGLLLKSFSNLMDVDLGMSTEHIVTFSMQLPETKYPSPDRKTYPNWPQAFQFYDTVLERAATMPGIRSAALGMNHPLDTGFTSQMTVVGKPKPPGPKDEVGIRPVSPAYFSTLGIAMSRGRGLSRDDRTTAPPVVVINEALAQKYFPNENPVGKQVEFWGTPRTIVGLVKGERFGGPQNAAQPALYPPLTQIPMSALSLIVRSTSSESATIAQVKSMMKSIDPDIALSDVGTLDHAITQTVQTPRFQAILITSFGAIALLLAAIGLYALISYQVQQRTNEIGIRIALGATTAEVARMVLRRAAMLAIAGVAIGLAGAFATRKFLAALLFQTSTTDPAIYIGVPLLLGAIVLIATYLPARRAMRVDPAVALRAE